MLTRKASNAASQRIHNGPALAPRKGVFSASSVPRLQSLIRSNPIDKLKEAVPVAPSTKPQKKPLYATDDDEDEDDLVVQNACESFIDRDDEFIQVMCCDYGFRTGEGRMYQSSDGKIPYGALQLSGRAFQKELEALRQSFRYNEYEEISTKNPATNVFSKAGYELGRGVVNAFSSLDVFLENSKLLPKLSPKPNAPTECADIGTKLQQLKLSNTAVWQRELDREAIDGGVKTPLIVRGVYLSLCFFLDIMFENRPIQRFWFLEKVARMPYFSYITILHLYESLGWWRAGAELRKVHFAEEWNELHHLQIMESLGGDQLWVDRFLAGHASIIYYIILTLLFLASPKLAYNFSELIEAHAVDTYGEFRDANASLLRSLPPPLVAAQYYRSTDLYMFYEFQTSKKVISRRPPCRSLYDVFSNICDDEAEHVNTMRACQDYTIIEELQTRKERGRSV